MDTNILVYAADEDSAEHAAASVIVGEMLSRPEAWILADQVLFEFYKALRNPRVFRHPLNAQEAARRIRFLREESGIARCCYELTDWEGVIPVLSDSSTPGGRTHDVILGATLIANGVSRFITRNTKDFEKTGFAELLNPIDR